VQARLRGRKFWCSGAPTLSHALLTAWGADGKGPYLVKVSLDQPAVRVTNEGWTAVGMAASSSVDVYFDDAMGTLLGCEGAYLERPGFWHGGAGIAACWYGAATMLATALHQANAKCGASSPHPFRQAALGKVDVALRQTSAMLRQAATWIDDHPLEDASGIALRVRLSAEDSARTVMEEVGRALGAQPFCRDQRFARMAADLPVFLRQSGAERDFAALGERVTQAPNPWTL
ncbi:MAG: acyl-CoA dehydrogenase, partial [Burkholderiaceae bacterium]